MNKSCLVLLAPLVLAIHRPSDVGAQEREPISLLLIDPGRMPDESRSIVRVDQTQPTYQWFALPGQGFSTASTTSAQLRLRSPTVIKIADKFTAGFTGYAAYARVDQHTAVHNRVQVGAALDHKFAPPSDPGITITVSGNYTNTQDVSRNLKAAGQFDIPLADFTLGGIAYYDKVTAHDGTVKTGATGAVVGSWTPVKGTQFGSEYDFKSDLSGEDAFVAKLMQSIGVWSTHAVTFTVAAGKHRLITTSLRIALN